MRFPKFIFLALLFVISISACNLPAKTPNAAATLQAIYTAQAATVQTNGVSTRTPQVLPTLQFPTLPPFTALPSTPVPTITTQSQNPSSSANRCDWAAFVKDVTVPDGTVFAPAVQFTKTWRLQNIGACSWTTAYTLVFSSGDLMGGPTTMALPGNVNPGQTVDISVNLIAPSVEGTHVANWYLRNAAGVVFGVGEAAQNPFWVSIKVVGGMTTIFDFAAEYCHADWRSGAGDLGCPGNENGKKGYAIAISNPQLENGQTYNGSAILTVPERVNNGYLQGYYQPINLQKGDRFRAIINCAYLANGCSATFRLDYQFGNGPVKTFWTFNEAYDNLYYTVDLDLNPLVGQPVVLILTVHANGPAELDKPIWVAPRIDRPSNLITPSLTPSRTPTVTVTTIPPTGTATATPTVTGTATNIPNTNTPTATGTPTVTSTP